MNIAASLSRRRLLAVPLAVFALALALILYFLVTLTGSALALALIVPTKLSASNHSPADLSANYQPAKVHSGWPVRLIIPRINVNATIDPMGFTAGGAMEAPSGPRNVGWFRFGARPGNPGSAVIAGHNGRWKNGDRTVFDHLNKLSKGDSIYVEDERGATLAFVVRELRTYGPDKEAAEVFRSQGGTAHLNLITCDGPWIKISRSYASRLVVFADKK